MGINIGNNQPRINFDNKKPQTGPEAKPEEKNENKAPEVPDKSGSVEQSAQDLMAAYYKAGVGLGNFKFSGDAKNQKTVVKTLER